MSERYPGGFVNKTAPVLNPASGNAAPGIWTMDQLAQARQAGTWPAYDPYFKYTTMLLHGNGTNGAQNNTFLDSSTNSFTITRNGNTTQGTFTPYGELWSNYFDGTGDYLNLTGTALGSGNFTVECWFNMPSWSTSNYPVIGSASSGTTAGWELYLNGPNSNIRLWSNAGDVISSSTTIQKGVWYHLALVRSGSTATLYINGVNTGSATFTSNLTNTTMYVSYDQYGQTMTGYVSNVRHVVGTAVYTSNFTPSTAPLTAITNTSLLTCQSNRFIDNSSNAFTITANGDTSVQRFSPFNPTTPYAAGTIGGSGYFDGSGDYLVCGAASDWAFMSNSTALWSVEMWVYPTVLGSATTLLDTSQSTTANVGMAMQINANRTVQVEIYRGSAGTYVVTGNSTSTLVANQWNHILATYDQSLASQNLKFYINGGSAETANKTANAPSSSNPNRAMTIATYGAGGGQFFTGYIGSMRISNVIRSSGVPTAPYTSDANTVLLTNYTNGGIIDNAMMNDLETVGNAQISTSVSKFGGGSLAFDGTGDYLIFPANSTLQFGTGDFTLEFWTYLNSVSGSQMFIDNRNGTASTSAYITIYSSGSTLYFYTTGNDRITATSVLSTSVWLHIAVARSGTSTKMFLNGTQVGSTYTDSNSYLAASTNQYIGARVSANDFNLNGYIDDLRITKGYARYTTNFTPQRSQWQDQ